MDYVLVQITGKAEMLNVNNCQALGDAPWVISQVERFAESVIKECPQQRPLELVDISHSTSYGRMSLMLLLACYSPLTPAAVSMGLRTALAATGLQVGVETLKYDEVQSVVGQHQEPAYVLSILGKHFSFELFSRVNKIFARYALKVLSTRRLSSLEPVPLAAAQNRSLLQTAQSETETETGLIVLEYRLRGAEHSLNQVRDDLLALSHYLHVDLAFQRDDLLRRAKRLVVFDMDSTLIKAEVIDELAKRAGVGDAVSAITERAMQGEIDFSKSFCERLALLRGLSASVLEEVARDLPLMDGVESLVATLRAQGIKTAIVSGGFTFFARFLQQRLGIDYIFANELSVDAGLVTGEAVLPIVDAQRKADIVRQLAEELACPLSQVVAVGDGANDLLMLEAAGMGIAFRAKPLVRQSAKLSLTTAGLEGVLYLMGIDEHDHVVV